MSKKSEKMALLIKIFALCTIFLVFLASIYEYVENNGANGCEMTYMYEMPEYIKMNLKSDVQRKYPRYNLYAYGEGGQAMVFKEANPPVMGVPVLFIPGNAGSYKQVRSMGSVAYRMGHHRSLTTQFDFYSIDFNEELYGFYGGNLHKQTEFVRDCIYHILSIYKTDRKPSQVVLVGHSMGGLLARALVTLDNFDKSLVSLIITQSTPHQEPLLYNDYLPDFYEEVNSYWQKEKDNSLKNVVLISLGGGDRDILVSYYATRLDGLTNSNRAISANTESLPRGWVSTDHLCAVWCRQVVLSLVRALCDLTVDKSSNLKSQLSHVRKAFGFHMINNTGHHSYTDTSSEEIKLSDQFEYDNLETDHLLLHDYTSTMDKYFSMKIEKGKYNEMVIESNNRWKSWVFGCTMTIGQDSCTSGVDLTPLQRLAPTKTTRVYMHINTATLQKYTHILIHVKKVTSPIFLNAIIFNTRTHTKVYQAPTALDLALDFPRSLYHHRDPVINRTEPKLTYQIITLPSLTSLYQAYRVDVEITQCQTKKAVTGFMRLHMPWAFGADTYSTIEPAAGGGNLSLKLQVPYTGNSDPAQLHLYLQPTCQYRVSVNIDFRKVLSQFARYYYKFLPSFVVANLFMVLCHQLFVVSRGMPCPDIGTAQDTYGQPWKLALATTVIELILCQKPVAELLTTYGLPLSDGALLDSKGFMIIGLHLILYTLALVIVRVYALVTRMVLSSLGAVMRVLFHKIFTHHTIPVIGSIVWWIALILGIYSSWNYSGSVGLLVTYALLIADIISSMVTFPSGDRRHTMWYLQHTLLLLTFSMFVLALPEFVTWIKNYNYTKTLDKDPSRYPSIVIATSLMLVRFNTDYENWYLSYANSFSPVILGVAALCYGTVNIWRLNVLIPTVFVWVASVQSLGILLHRQKNSEQIFREKSENLLNKQRNSPRSQGADNSELDNNSDSH